jgi:hypothetical protein
LLDAESFPKHAYGRFAIAQRIENHDPSRMRERFKKVGLKVPKHFAPG